jgi:hypothetical protein
VGVCPTGALKAKRQWLLEDEFTPAEIMNMTRSDRRRRRSGSANDTFSAERKALHEMIEKLDGKQVNK